MCHACISSKYMNLRGKRGRKSIDRWLNLVASQGITSCQYSRPLSLARSEIKAESYATDGASWVLTCTSLSLSPLFTDPTTNAWMTIWAPACHLSDRSPPPVLPTFIQSLFSPTTRPHEYVGAPLDLLKISPFSFYWTLKVHFRVVMHAPLSTQ